MKNKIQLITQNGVGKHYFTVPFVEGMEKSELARIIGAEELKEFDIRSGHIKEFDNFVENHEKLVNEDEYRVYTHNLEKTEALIRKYQSKNQDINQTNNSNHDINLMDSYKD
jgi:hypothetical protein